MSGASDGKTGTPCGMVEYGIWDIELFGLRICSELLLDVWKFRPFFLFYSMRATEPRMADDGSSSDDERAAAVTRYVCEGRALGEDVGTAFQVLGFDSHVSAPSVAFPASLSSSRRPFLSSCIDELVAHWRTLVVVQETCFLHGAEGPPGSCGGLGGAAG